MRDTRVSRRPASPVRTVHIGFVVQGAAVLAPPGGAPVVVPARQVCVVADWSAIEISCTPGTRIVSVSVPETLLRERGVRVHPDRIRLEGKRTLSAPIVALAESLLDPAWMPTASALQVAEHAMESLIVGLLLE